MVTKQKISFAPSIRRLPQYLHVIRQFESTGGEYISGTLIANELNLEPIQVRKDLAITGIIGKPKRGYPAGELIKAIEHYLGWDISHKAIVVGAGNLGSALMGYQEFRNNGLDIIAGFDTDPTKIGSRIHGVQIYNIDSLNDLVGQINPEIAILTVPSPYAQSSCESIVKSGIKSIWNFTNTKLKVPEYVSVQREDLSSGYAMLSVMSQQLAKSLAETASQM
jgi:redox-sensing transcriptional repressor